MCWIYKQNCSVNIRVQNNTFHYNFPRPHNINLTWYVNECAKYHCPIGINRFLTYSFVDTQPVSKCIWPLDHVMFTWHLSDDQLAKSSSCLCWCRLYYCTWRETSAFTDVLYHSGEPYNFHWVLPMYFIVIYDFCIHSYFCTTKP